MVGYQANIINVWVLQTIWLKDISLTLADKYCFLSDWNITLSLDSMSGWLDLYPAIWPTLFSPTLTFHVTFQLEGKQQVNECSALYTWIQIEIKIVKLVGSLFLFTQSFWEMTIWMHSFDICICHWSLFNSGIIGHYQRINE